MAHVRARTYVIDRVTILINMRRSAMDMETFKPPSPRRWPRLLLLIPFIAVLWVPLYNSTEPTLLSIPFFYWYQLAWIPLCTLVIYCVYRLEG
jgi:hypothetical protein